MEKIALITDSTCGLPQEYIDKYNVNIVRLKVIYNDAEYLDGVDISPEEVYLKINDELPTTSMPSVEDVCNIYNDLIEKGYTHVISLPISSGLSGTINSFRLAASEYEDKITSFVFDTKMVSLPVSLFVVEIGEMIINGKSFNEICSIAPKLRENTEMYFTVDTLEYLIKGGRIGRVSGGVGQLLNLKPIIRIDDDGKYVNYSKARGSKKALNELISISTSILDKSECKVVIATGTMHEEAEKLKEKLIGHKNLISIQSGIITPVVGIHSGPRILGIGIMSTKL